MDTVPSRGLVQEVAESLLLFAVAALTLGGYLGLAFVFVGVVR